MYSQEMLLILLLLLTANENLDLNNNNIVLIIAIMLVGYPQYPYYNSGCGCNRNRLFVNQFWYIRKFLDKKMADIFCHFLSLFYTICASSFFFWSACSSAVSISWISPSINVSML